MAQHAHVPKFGNWENDGNVPYTQYFDNARKGRTGGKLINPNDPTENPEAFSADIPSRTSEDDLRRHDATAQKPSAGSSLHRKAGHVSGGPEQSIERSPLHPRQQARAASKGGVSSPSWERKDSSDGAQGLTSGSAGRARMRTGGRDDETPERGGSSVPKFGDWDEKDPSSADGYTHIFNKVRLEKQSGSGNAPNIANDAAHRNGSQRDGNEPSSCSCFGWCK
ncbi:RPM1-interacting protein 4-like [Ananas comosus]|uniref:RPM1-interacting protein 4-like n=1 Tax=Ananas comosus TaxID=4615 RepID=A0A6P5EJX5_ANACO|nr:RPM1-interacting protein 4-like [Ananas comosus]